MQQHSTTMRPSQRICRTSVSFCTSCRGRAVRRRVTGAELLWLRCLTQSARSESATAAQAQENDRDDSFDALRPSGASSGRSSSANASDHPTDLGSNSTQHDSFLSRWGSDIDMRTRPIQKNDSRGKNSGQTQGNGGQDRPQGLTGKDRRREFWDRKVKKFHNKPDRQQTPRWQQTPARKDSMSVNDFEAELGRTFPSSISGVSSTSQPIGPRPVEIPSMPAVTPMPPSSLGGVISSVPQMFAASSGDATGQVPRQTGPERGLPSDAQSDSGGGNSTVTVGPAFPKSSASNLRSNTPQSSNISWTPPFRGESSAPAVAQPAVLPPISAKKMSALDFESEFKAGQKPAKKSAARKKAANDPNPSSVSSFLSMFDHAEEKVGADASAGESVSVKTMTNTFAAVETRRKTLASAQGEEFWSLLSGSSNGNPRSRQDRGGGRPYDSMRSQQGGMAGRDAYRSRGPEGGFMPPASGFAPLANPTYGEASDTSRRLKKGKDVRDRRGREFIYEEEEAAPARKSESKKEKAARKAASGPTPVLIPEFISVQNLAQTVRVETGQFQSKMKAMGFEETSLDHILDAETAGLIALEFNCEPMVDETSADLVAQPVTEDMSALPSRPPVVTIMGHVDHGKTTLLDFLRKSSVAASEHGGITQHIGAFSVPLASGKTITFLDTPGHEAFLSMRERGANVTDIVVLVVAADDSVKPQTIEAIKHAKAAGVPMIVAISKVDKEESNIDRVKQDLARYEVDIEDYGGETQVIPVSGKTGKGMDELEEAIITLSEIQDMRADDSGLVEGWVLETAMKGRGKVATVLVRRGTLTAGDLLVAGTTFARVRTIVNEAGDELGFASPGTAVEIDGWREQPNAGDEVLQANDESHAKEVLDYRSWKLEIASLATDMEAINATRRQQQLERRAEAEDVNVDAPAEPEGPKTVKFIVRGDVDGSIEAVSAVVSSIGNDQVKPSILKAAVGPISESDIYHAAAASASIISFNRAPEPQIVQAAAMQGVNIIAESIIYRVIEEVKAELSKHLPPVVTQRVVGEAEISQVFKYRLAAGKTLPIAGCKVRNGVILKNQKARVTRRGEVIYEGTIESLKNVKKDVTEMRKGNECGMGFGGWEGFRSGDVVQCYEEKSEPQTL